jgi:hypothetical protein
MNTRPHKEMFTPKPAAAAAPAPQPQATPARPLIWPAVVTGTLFFGWLGYLLFLVLTLPSAPGGGPVVLSRPQFLVSDLDVIAEVLSLKGPVNIKEVVNPPSERHGSLKGKSIVVTNLAKCGPSGRDYTGPGEYILALRPTGLIYGATLVGLLGVPGDGGWLALAVPPLDVATAVSYEVVPTPPSPGFRLGPPRLYRAIKENVAQLRQIKKP